MLNELTHDRYITSGARFKDIRSQFRTATGQHQSVFLAAMFRIKTKHVCGSPVDDILASVMQGFLAMG